MYTPESQISLGELASVKPYTDSFVNYNDLSLVFWLEEPFRASWWWKSVAMQLSSLVEISLASHR